MNVTFSYSDKFTSEKVEIEKTIQELSNKIEEEFTGNLYESLLKV